MATTESTPSTRTAAPNAVAKVTTKASVPTSNCTVLPLPVPPQVITYCLGETMVYVKPAKEYEEAIDLAIQEFPILRTIASEKTESDWKNRIKLYIMSSVNGKQQYICISKSAYQICTQRMLRGEVITIRVVDPEAVAAEALKTDTSSIGSPPQYLEVPKHPEKEKVKSSRLQKSMSWFSHKQ